MNGLLAHVKEIQKIVDDILLSLFQFIHNDVQIRIHAHLIGSSEYIIEHRIRIYDAAVCRQDDIAFRDIIHHILEGKRLDVQEIQVINCNSMADYGK